MRKLLVVGLLVLAGCNNKLVTGYQPRRLGDSPAARAAYYAGRFTPEARAAEQERAAEVRSRSPVTPSGAGQRY